MAKYVCSICGYVAEGEAPEKCPVCGAGKDKFTMMAEGQKNYADEHRIGVAKDVDPEILEGLRANFMGECTEVGMYIAMARQADREGYPEIAEAFKRYAFEEADHASVVTDSTKRNLELRAEAEFGACDGKMKIAKRAKELGLDAVHDTVHEMAKDEARHGRGFDGLLARYFA